MTINELRAKRNQAWEAAKAFVATKRDKDGLLSAEDAATYNQMEQKVKDYSAEIDRMERQEAIDREMNAPTSTPITTKPNATAKVDTKTGIAADAYKEAFWNATRTRDGISYEVRNSLKVGVAAVFLLTHVGAPMIFYGDEQGLSGWHEIEYRRPMNWSLKDTNLFDFYRKAIQLRRQHMDAILTGYQILYADEAVLAYGCSHHADGFLVVMNLSDEQQRRTIPVPKKLQGALHDPVDYFTLERYSTEGDNLILDLRANSANVIPFKGQ